MPFPLLKLMICESPCLFKKNMNLLLAGWVLVAAHKLSLVSESWGLLPSRGAWASNCGEGAEALGARASVVAAQGH